MGMVSTPADVIRVLGDDAVHCDGCGGWHHARYHDRRIDDLIASYEAKVQDFAAETRRVSLYREALGWVLYQYMHQQPYHRVFEDGTSPPVVLDIIRSVRDGGLPPDRAASGYAGSGANPDPSQRALGANASSDSTLTTHHQEDR